VDRSAEWLKQAERDLAAAEVSATAGHHNWAAFQAQQAAEKAVKALVQHLHGSVRGHAVKEILEEPSSLRFGCRELRNLMYVLPNGNLITCGLKHRPIGNLAHEKFEDLWFGEKIKTFRDAVDACEGCMQMSIKMQSRLYNGKLG